MTAVILGCGYTGRRVARLLLDDGLAVHATTRDPARLADLARAGARVTTPDALEVAPGARLLHSVPARVPFAHLAPARVVYLSSTGVYGRAPEVDERTEVAPVTERQRARVAVEREVLAGPWSALVLRPAAIYGPGRGIHVAMREGRHALAGDGSRPTSRIHVDDLAAICAAALMSDLAGAFPVADDGSAPAREVAEFCAHLLGVPVPPPRDPAELPETLRLTRRVDGRAVRAALGVTLRFPSFREGIPAALAAEGA